MELLFVVSLTGLFCLTFAFINVFGWVAGWKQLLDFADSVDMFDVAERLWDLQTVRMERQWNEPTGFEDQEDVLEARVHDSMTLYR